MVSHCSYLKILLSIRYLCCFHFAAVHLVCQQCKPAKYLTYFNVACAALAVQQKQDTKNCLSYCAAQNKLLTSVPQITYCTSSIRYSPL